MKKLLFLAILGLSCFVCSLPVYAEEVQREVEVQELTEEQKQFAKALGVVSQSSISIKFLYDHGGMGFCTGTLINNQENPVVLTAKHCLDNMAVEIYADGVKVKDYKHDKNLDIAWLILEEKLVGKTPITLANKEVKIKDIVFVFAYPPRHREWIEVGPVDLKTIRYDYAKLKVIGGCSGGGVFNMNGELVGVLWGSVSDITIYTPLDKVKNILIKNNILFYEAVKESVVVGSEK